MDAEQEKCEVDAGARYMRAQHALGEL
jgi:hypothetical protein